jgi:hypothetical protein
LADHTSSASYLAITIFMLAADCVSLCMLTVLQPLANLTLVDRVCVFLGEFAYVCGSQLGNATLRFCT